MVMLNNILNMFILSACPEIYTVHIIYDHICICRCVSPFLTESIMNESTGFVGVFKGFSTWAILSHKTKLQIHQVVQWTISLAEWFHMGGTCWILFASQGDHLSVHAFQKPWGAFMCRRKNRLNMFKHYLSWALCLPPCTQTPGKIPEATLRKISVARQLSSWNRSSTDDDVHP